MTYIKRDIEKVITKLDKEYSCILLTGSRQVGKSTLFKHLMKSTRTYITLDDLEERKLAKNDPALFFQMHDLPILIDEVQYAPELFSYIKIAVDNGAKPGSFWLTGSQPFQLMELAQESLAGRTAILHLPAISQHELYGQKENIPFSIDLNSLKQRRALYKPASLKEIYKRIWRGSLPAIVSEKYTENIIYYSSYVQTYINRDVSDIAKVDQLLFSDFIKSAACRTAQMLNIHDIARDVGISDDTAKRWLKILEKSDIIYFLRPYSNNLLKRTLKTPKLYFFDTGLVAYLTSHSTPELLANGAINGAILENYIVTEIRKTYFNNGLDCPMWYYRDKSNNEIDIIIENDGKLHPIEIKRSANPASELINAFSVLNKASIPKGKGAVICMKEDLSAFNSDNFIIPVWMI